jgi:hypothetical protein
LPRLQAEYFAKALPLVLLLVALPIAARSCSHLPIIYSPSLLLSSYLPSSFVPLFSFTSFSCCLFFPCHPLTMKSDVALIGIAFGHSL